jgi:Tfp pilus assembly pilus retraction ATPase PilT
MQVGAQSGMHTFDDSLLHLVKGGYLGLEEAMLNSREPESLKIEFQNFLRSQAKK